MSFLHVRAIDIFMTFPLFSFIHSNNDELQKDILVDYESLRDPTSDNEWYYEVLRATTSDYEALRCTTRHMMMYKNSFYKNH